MDFINRKSFWDRFVSVIPVTRLGWTEKGGFYKKGKGWKVCLVSRLKKERKIPEILKHLEGVRFSFKFYLVGEGDENLLKGRRVIHIKRKVDAFGRLLGGMDVLVYHTAGSDKSCRTVLEAMANGTLPVTSEHLARRYVEGDCGVFTLNVSETLDRLFSVPLLVRKMTRNAFKRAEKFSLRSSYDNTPGPIPLKL